MIGVEKSTFGRSGKLVRRLLLSFIVVLSIFLGIVMMIFIFLKNSTLSKDDKHIHLPENTGSDLSVLLNGTPEYYLNDGSSHPINNFGLDEYQCTGSCYCGEERKTSSSLLASRSLRVVVSAFSVLTATFIAKKSFQSRCDEQFYDDDTCENPSLIHSEVDDCSKKGDKDIPIRISEESSLIAEEDVTEDMKKMATKYSCSGFCVHYTEENMKVDGYFKDENSKNAFNQLGHEKIGFCESITLKRDVLVGFDPRASPDSHLNNLRFQFASSALNPYCSQQSQLKHEWFSPEERRKQEEYAVVFEEMLKNHADGKSIAKQFLRAIPFCLGMIFGVDSNGNANVASLDNVQCEEISHEDQIKKGYTSFSEEEK